MEDELLERLTALRHDEQAASLAVGDERLLDGPAAGDELLGLEIDQVDPRRRMDPAGTRSAARAPPPAPTRAAAAGPTDHRVERRTGGPRPDGTGGRVSGGRAPYGRARGSCGRAPYGRGPLFGGRAPYGRAAGWASVEGGRSGRTSAPGRTGPPPDRPSDSNAVVRPGAGRRDADRRASGPRGTARLAAVRRRTVPTAADRRVPGLADRRDGRRSWVEGDRRPSADGRRAGPANHPAVARSVVRRPARRAP